MQRWMMVHLCNQRSHFQLPCSCSSHRKQQAASKAEAEGVTPHRQGKNMLWEQGGVGQGRGRRGGEWQKRSGTEEVH